MAEPFDEGDWITTYTGRWSFAEPRAEDVRIEDIAHSLALQCRYNGHVPTFYSVAQHSVIVSELQRVDGFSPSERLDGLLHDAAETYIGDMRSTLKHRMTAFCEVEAQVEAAVAERFGRGHGFARASHVAYYDRLVVALEAHVLFGVDPGEWGFDESWDWRRFTPHLVTGWPPERAEQEFLGLFRQLMA